MDDLVQIRDPLSTFSGEVDRLFIYLTVISSLAVFVIAFLMIWFSIKYRRRANGKSMPLEKGLIVEAILIGIPFIFFMLAFVWGAKVYTKAMRVPEDTLQIFGVGKQWMWKFQHPEGRREINELHIPIGRPVQVTLISQDVIHSFFIPKFRIKMDVLPKRYTNVWFQANRKGTFHLFCAEYCGLDHSRMRGTVYALTESEYAAWVQEGSAEGIYETAAGKELYQRFNCHKCHDTPELVPAPSLRGLYGSKVQLDDGQTIVADEKYIRESIVYPAKDIVRNYPNVMPTFQYQLSETQIVDLIIYIKSLSGDELSRQHR